MKRLSFKVSAYTVSEAKGPKVLNSTDIVSACEHIRSLAQEAFLVVSLNRKHKIINIHMVSLGTLTATLVHPREVFRPVILDAAASIALVHNHPSGEVEPSVEDREITKRLAECSKLLGINLLDHVILGKSDHYSFAADGLI